MWFSKSRKIGLFILSQAETARFIDQLHPGEILQGRILWKLPEGKYLIHILGRNVIAQASEQFAEGDYVNLRVESLGPPIIMSLSQTSPAPSEAEVISRILSKLRLPDTEFWRSVVRKALRQKRRFTSHRVDVAG